jgi:carbon storage regulator
MLVLSRKVGEKVVIGGDIVLTVVEIDGNRIRLGIDAPGDVRILRAELADWMEQPAAPSRPAPRLVRQRRALRARETAAC